MPVKRIERVVAGTVIGRAERGADGLFACHEFGSNVAPVRMATMDDVASYLRTHSGSGVRMNPGWRKITENIYVDGVLLR